MPVLSLILGLLMVPHFAPNYERVYTDVMRFPDLATLKKGLDFNEEVQNHVAFCQAFCLSWQYERYEAYDELSKELCHCHSVWYVAWDAADDVRLANGATTESFRQMMLEQAYSRYEELRKMIGDKDFWQGTLPLPAPYGFFVDVDDQQ